MWAISYIIRNPKVLYYLFNIVKNADNKSYIINTEETGIDILKNYDSLVVLPSNDGCIDAEKTKEKCQKAGIPVLSIGNYGHMSFLVSDVKDLIIEKIEETSERKL